MSKYLKLRNLMFSTQVPFLFSGAFLVSENFYIGLFMSTLTLLCLYSLPFYEKIKKSQKTLRIILIYILVSFVLGVLRQYSNIPFSIISFLFLLNGAISSIIFYREFNIIYQPLVDSINPNFEATKELEILFKQTEKLDASFILEEGGETNIVITRDGDKFIIKMVKTSSEKAETFLNEFDELEGVAIFINSNTPLIVSNLSCRT